MAYLTKELKSNLYKIKRCCGAQSTAFVVVPEPFLRPFWTGFPPRPNSAAATHQSPHIPSIRVWSLSGTAGPWNTLLDLHPWIWPSWIFWTQNVCEPRPCWKTPIPPWRKRTTIVAPTIDRASRSSGTEPTWLTMRRGLRAIKTWYPLLSVFFLVYQTLRLSMRESETDRSRTPVHWARRPPVPSPGSFSFWFCLHPCQVLFKFWSVCVGFLWPSVTRICATFLSTVC
jgi:hypothetical protein